MRYSVVLAAIATLALTACSSSSAPQEQEERSYADMDPAQILDDAVDAMRGLESVRVRDTLENTAAGDGSVIRVDVTQDRNGDCSGSVTGRSGRTEVRLVDGISYSKPPRHQWEKSFGVGGADRYAGFWTSFPTGLAAVVCAPDVDRLEGEVVAREVTGEGWVDGLAVVAVAFTGKDGDDSGTLHVARDEPHVILRLEYDGDQPKLFSDFDEEFEVEAPPPSKVVDLNQLHGRPGTNA